MTTDGDDPDWKPGRDAPVEPLLSNGALALTVLITGVIATLAIIAALPGLAALNAGVMGVALGKLHERSLW